MGDFGGVNPDKKYINTIHFIYLKLESKYPLCYIMNRKGEPQAVYPQISNSN